MFQSNLFKRSRKKELRYLYTKGVCFLLRWLTIESKFMEMNKRKILMGHGKHSRGFTSLFPDMLGTKQNQTIKVYCFQNMHSCNGNHKRIF